MKILIDTLTKESKHYWADNVDVVVGESCTTSPFLIIGDMNSTNATLIENVTLPDDWVGGGKYLYDAGAWTLNPNWVDPTQPVQE